MMHMVYFIFTEATEGDDLSREKSVETVDRNGTSVHASCEERCRAAVREYGHSYPDGPDDVTTGAL